MIENRNIVNISEENVGLVFRPAEVGSYKAVKSIK